MIECCFPFPRNLSSLAVLCLFASAGVARSQSAPISPGAAAPSTVQQRPRGPRPAPVNLKVLSKDMTGDAVIKLMRQYEGDLGVECEFCHAKNPTTGRNDFASDANPMKDRARVMIAMTNQINATYLKQLTDPPPTNPVTCGTCHQGAAHPAVFIPKPEQHGQHPTAIPVPPAPQSK